MTDTLMEYQLTPLNAIKTATEALAAIITAGKLAVNASGVTLTADLVDVDMNAITGTAPNNRTLYQIEAALLALRTTGTLDGIITALAYPVGGTPASVTIAATDVAQQLTITSTPCKFVDFWAPSTAADLVSNTEKIKIGNVTAQGKELHKANFEGIRYYTTNANLIYVIGQINDVLWYQVHT